MSNNAGIVISFNFLGSILMFDINYSYSLLESASEMSCLTGLHFPFFPYQTLPALFCFINSAQPSKDPKMESELFASLLP